MPNEKVLNLPLSGAEIIEVLLQRYEHRLRHDCFLHEAATYNGFSYDLNCTIKFRDMNMGKETLIWDRHTQAPKELTEEEKSALIAEFAKAISDHSIEKAFNRASEVSEKFDTLSLSPVKGEESPNAVRQEHELEIPVQVQEGRKTVIRKRKFPKDAA